MEFNENQVRFLESMQKSLSSFGWNSTVFFAMIFLLGGIIGGALFTSWIFNHRYSLLREFYYWAKKVLPNKEVSPRRYEANYPVSVLFPNTNQPSNRAQTVDLSPDGMFIKMISPFPADSSFEFILRLGNGTEIKGMALVRWAQKSWSQHHPAGMGCEFLDLSETDRDQIRDYLRQSRAPRFVTQPTIKMR